MQGHLAVTLFAGFEILLLLHISKVIQLSAAARSAGELAGDLQALRQSGVPALINNRACSG
jgi:hypothetical protein